MCLVKGNDNGHNVKHNHSIEANHECSGNMRFPGRDFNTGSPELEVQMPTFIPRRPLEKKGTFEKTKK